MRSPCRTSRLGTLHLAEDVSLEAIERLRPLYPTRARPVVFYAPSSSDMPSSSPSLPSSAFSSSSYSPEATGAVENSCSCLISRSVESSVAHRFALTSSGDEVGGTESTWLSRLAPAKCAHAYMERW